MRLDELVGPPGLARNLLRGYGAFLLLIAWMLDLVHQILVTPVGMLSGSQCTHHYIGESGARWSNVPPSSV